MNNAKANLLLPLAIWTLSTVSLTVLSLFLSPTSNLYPTLFILALTFPAGLVIYRDDFPLEDYGIHFQKPLQLTGWILIPPVVILPLFAFGYIYLFPGRGRLSSDLSFLTPLVILSQIFYIALPEEFLFRGFLQTRIVRYFKSSKFHCTKAILLTSLLFALAHMAVAGSLKRAEVFFPSLVFGWLREKSTSIWPAIFFHGFSNLLYFYLHQP